MNRFDAAIKKFNFRKAVTVYLVLAVLAGILSAGFLVHTFRGRLVLARGYRKVSEQADGMKNGYEGLKPELNQLAASSPDLVDILILDGQNRILFTAKHSDLSKEGFLNLAEEPDGQNRYFADTVNPNLHFRLLESDRLKISKGLLGIDEEAEREMQDRSFYKKQDRQQKNYLLSYLTDEPGGSKIYFISSAQPVPRGEFYLKAAAALAVLFFMVYWVLLALWVYAQALKARMDAAVWGIATLFTNLAGWLVFLLYRQSRQTCYRCGTVQNKDNAYCTCCGAKLGKICPRCHMSGSEDDRYCKHCGSAFDENQNRKD
jgi:hypothetical protein